MKSFFQATPKTPKPPKILLPGSYISEVATWVWDRANAKKRWPAYSQRAKIHPSYKTQDNDYGHLGNLYAKLHPEMGDGLLKMSFDSRYKPTKRKSSRVKAERSEALRSELISELSTRLKDKAIELSASLGDVVYHGKVHEMPPCPPNNDICVCV